MNLLNKIFVALNLLLALSLVIIVSRRSHPTDQARPAGNAAVKVEKPIETVRKVPSFSNLESAGDWRQWIDQLRAAGVPTPVIANLVLSGFDDRWVKRQAQAEASYQKGEIDSDMLSALGIQRDREREIELRAAIGDAAFKSLDLTNVLQNLPLNAVTVTSTESESLYDFEKKMERAVQDANEAKLKGQIDQAECDNRLQQAKTERDQQIKALLGDKRYTDMFPPPPVATEESQRVVLPPTGDMSELPFDALLYMQSQLNEKRSDVESRLQEAKTQAANSEEELQKINNAWETEFRRVLGTNTYDAVQKENDTSYKEMKRYADQWSLDGAAMDYAYRMIQYYNKTTAEYERQARALEAKGEDVDWEGVEKNIRQFGTEMQQSLQSYLGQESYDRLKYNNLLPFARKTPASTN